MNLSSRTMLFVAMAMLGVVGAANATLVSYAANLNGPSESPPNASPGSGLAQVDIDTAAHTLHVNVTFSGLLGTVTASHIHAATTVAGTGTAGVATMTPTFVGFPSGVTSGSYDHTFDTTLASSFNGSYVTANGGTAAGAETSLAAALAGGKAYLNIHTNVFPGGEIRGFLLPIPEPATVLFAMLGGAGLLIRRPRVSA